MGYPLYPRPMKLKFYDLMQFFALLDWSERSKKWSFHIYLRSLLKYYLLKKKGFTPPPLSVTTPHVISVSNIRQENILLDIRPYISGVIQCWKMSNVFTLFLLWILETLCHPKLAKCFNCTTHTVDIPYRDIWIYEDAK